MKAKRRALLRWLWIIVGLILVFLVIVIYRASKKQTNSISASTVIYTNSKFNFRLTLPQSGTKYMSNPQEILFTSQNPYNPISGVVLCSDPKSGEQCNDGIVIYIFDSSKCSKNTLDELSSDWCELRSGLSGEGVWQQIYPNSETTALWIKDFKYYFSMEPRGEEAKNILESSRFNFVK